MQHMLPLNPEYSPVKQKLRRMKPEMSLKIKEKVKKQFDAGFLAIARYPEWLPISCQSQRRMERCECAWTMEI